MGTILALLATAAALAFALRPLFTRDVVLEQPLPPPDELRGQRSVALSDIRDVDFDHELGNLSDEDYQELRERYKRRAVSILKQMNAQEGELDDEIEQAVAALRGGGSKSSV